MRRRPLPFLSGAVFLALVSTACSAFDQATPPTTTTPDPVVLGTLPPVVHTVTTEPLASRATQPPTEPPIEPGSVTIDEPIAAAVDAPQMTAPSVVEFAGLPLSDIAVSPSGRWIAINRDTQICLLDTTVGSTRSDEGCVEFDGPIGPRSLAWSPDESTVAFHHDWPLLVDSDIVVLDVATRSLEVLTDDGTDDLETGELDVAPFYSDDGTLHFLRAAPDPSLNLPERPFNVVEFRNAPVVLDGVVVEHLPRSARQDPGGGPVVIEVTQRSERFPSIAVIDADARTSTLIDGGIDRINGRPILDVAGKRALIAQGPVAALSGVRAALIDLTGAASPQALPATSSESDRAVGGVGLSPDGTAIVFIIVDLNDPLGHELAVAPILDDGSIGPLGVIATGEEFAPNNGDKTIVPGGLGIQREVVWVRNAIIFGLGPKQIVTVGLN